MSDVRCPYCNEPQEIVHDDGYGYEEDKIHEQECGKCEKAFAFTTFISFYYEAHKAECLNGGEHDWEPMVIFPRLWPDARRCAACGLEERGEPVSAEERDKILNRE